MRMLILPGLCLAFGMVYMMALSEKVTATLLPVHSNVSDRETSKPSYAVPIDKDKLDRAAKMARYEAQLDRDIAIQARAQAEVHKRNVADYLLFKGWKCGTVYGHMPHETNRTGLVSNEISCLEKRADGSAVMRSYLITMNERTWGNIVREKKFDRRDRALISALPQR